MVRRQGRVVGDSLAIDLRADALDGALDSLNVQMSDGAAVWVEFETPKLAAANEAFLNRGDAMLDLLERLVGWHVRIETDADAALIEGRLTGLQFARRERSPQGAAVIVFDPVSAAVRLTQLERIVSIVPLDRQVGDELVRFLDGARRVHAATRLALHFAPGERDVELGYLISCPPWRLGYRALVRSVPSEAVAAQAAADSLRSRLHLQGWATIDNHFGETLRDVELDLVSAAQASAAGRAAGSGAVTQTAAAALGHKALQYRSTMPLTLPQASSALVPIIDLEFDCRQELLFDDEHCAEHPMIAIRFENTSSVVLDEAAATLFVDDRYLGETRLGLTLAGQTVHLTYAHEPGVDVQRRTEVGTERHDVRFVGDMLVQQGATIRSTHYSILNRMPSARTVMIRRSIESLRGELFDCPAPDVQGGEHLGWTVHCPPGERVEHTVRTRESKERTQPIAEMPLERLDELLRGASLAQPARSLLTGVRAELARIEENAEQVLALQEQQSRLVKRQEHLRRNIGALASTGDEGDVRLKMVRELQAAEGALSGIEQLVGELRIDSETRRRAIPTRFQKTTRAL